MRLWFIYPFCKKESFYEHAVQQTGAQCHRVQALIYPVQYLPISPLLIAQALHTRAKTLKLPEPEGPRNGVSGHGPDLRLLIMGDSAAAGVGVVHQRDALSGQLVECLAERFRVSWLLEAESGATTGDTLERLAGMETRQFDVAVTSLGVNDVTGHVGLAKWIGQQRELRAQLKERFGVSLTVVSSLPPMHSFPALPRPLSNYLGDRATRFDNELKADLAAHNDGHYLDMRISDNPDLIAEDGFHPGPGVYIEWARRAADLILRYAKSEVVAG